MAHDFLPLPEGPDPDEEEWYEAEEWLAGRTLEDLRERDADEAVHARYDREAEDEERRPKEDDDA